jgi:hypothetical protein
MVYLIYSEPSIPYSIIAAVFYVCAFVFMIVKSKDGAEAIDAMVTLKVPSKYVSVLSNIRSL